MGQYYRLSVLNSPKKTSSNVDKVIATMSPYEYFNGGKTHGILIHRQCLCRCV